MYSVLLMMALTGGTAEAPAFGHHDCCGGCYGCCGYDYGCCGGWSNGCCGYDYGCCGGGHHHGCCGGGHGFFGGHHHDCCGGCYGCCGYDYSCCGGCCGGWSHGCCGGGHGFFGGHHHGCCGGCYGCCGGYNGCCGGWSSNCCGCYGGCGGYDAGAPVWGGAAPPAVGPVAPGGPAAPPADLPKDGKKTSLAAPASIVINLPADATLTIDGQATASTSETRKFTSPELAAGKDYSYTLRAEITRNGETLTAIEQVNVRAGEETMVSLPMSKFAAASVAAR